MLLLKPIKFLPVVIGQPIDVLDTPDYIALNELLILLTHRHERTLNLHHHLLKFTSDLHHLLVQTHVVQ
jgi:hypothetical protein